jgi:hypothetical protein
MLLRSIVCAALMAAVAQAGFGEAPEVEDMAPEFKLLGSDGQQ